MATFTGTAAVFNIHPKDFGDGNINYTTLTPECWLWTGAEPSPTWTRASNITNEVNRANGYTPTSLANHAWAQNAATAQLNSDPVEFIASGGVITAKGYILVLRDGTDANSPILTWGYLDSALQDDKTVSPPDKIQLTPNASNGWYITSNV